MLNLIPWGYKVSRPVIIPGTDLLAGYFAGILRSGKDFSVNVYGAKGVGKSITTAELIRNIHARNKKPFSLKKDIVFYLDEFYAAVNPPRPYTCKMLDDFGSEADSKRSMENKSINLIHYFHTSRTNKMGYFVTTPTKQWINKDLRDRVANYFIWITKQNKKHNFVTAKITYQQRNEITDKTYTHHLSITPEGIINNKGIGTQIKEWILYPLPQELIEEYNPYRLEKAQKNLEKGQKQLQEEQEKQTKKTFNPIPIADEIMKEIDKYYTIPLGRKKKALDAGLIQTKFNLGARKYLQIRSELTRRIQNQENEQNKN